MSESGKVSLPTAERMKAIREGVNNARRGAYWADISNEELRGVLAALEESQHQLIGKSEELAEAQQALDKPKHHLLFTLHNERANHEETRRQRDIAEANYKTYYAESLAVADRLAEAQQTIALQQKVIDWYESGGSMGELVKEGSDKA